jgi:hypothetical protein
MGGFCRLGYIMVFKVRSIDGVIDPRINLNGRPTKSDKPLTNKQIREREFLSLLRKVKPLLAPAIATAFKISQNEDGKDVDKLKASALIIGLYKELLGDAYDMKYDEQDAEEVQPTNKSPVFSLTMISGGKEIEKVEE